jgi:hypothetical protein
MIWGWVDVMMSVIGKGEKERGESEKSHESYWSHGFRLQVYRCVG